MTTTTAARRLTAATLLGTLLFSACSGDPLPDTTGRDTAAPPPAVDGPFSEGGAADEEAPDAATSAEAPGSARTQAQAGSLAALSVAQGSDRAIISRVDLAGVAEDPVQAAEQTRLVVIAAGGYVAEESTVRPPDEPIVDGLAEAPVSGSTFLLARVPADSLERTIEEISESGEITSRSSNARDVTEALVDLDSRVKSQRASIARLRSLLAEADKLGDIIAIESELASRDADLDSLLTRQAELGDLAALATVSVSWQTPSAAVVEPATDGFLVGLQAGWDAFVRTGTWLVTALGAVLPFVLLGAATVGSVVVLRRRRAAPVDPDEAASDESGRAGADVVDDAPQDVRVG